MYYKEAWINGKLCWKATPKGKWIPFTIGQYKERVLTLEAELKNLRLGVVVGQSEQLVAFGIWLDKNDKHLENGNITETVQEYLKGN